MKELLSNAVILLFNSRQDSPNLFHEASRFLNTYIIMNLLYIGSSNVYVLFLENIDFIILLKIKFQMELI